MSQMKILLVEDEADIRDLIRIQLESEGFQVTPLDNGTDAIAAVQSENFDLFVIDRMLPGKPGLDVCKFIRDFRPTKNHPILIVTALSRSENIIEGLNAGADDYITKPFDMKVLVARTKALLRRSLTSNNLVKTGARVVVFRKIRIDTDQCKVWVEDKELVLTASEYKLLTHMVQNSRKVLGRRHLVEMIQGDNINVTERTIDTHVFGLRKKLGDAANMIETIRGIGYRVNDNE
jgi:DNA-binding response OmpR family regulator